MQCIRRVKSAIFATTEIKSLTIKSNSTSLTPIPNKIYSTVKVRVTFF